MTVSAQLKERVRDVLEEFRPDETIAVVDAKQIDDVALPTLAVDVTGVSAHSDALSMVQAINMQLTLRVHSGDEDDKANVEDWISQIETTLHNPDEFIPMLNNGIKVFRFLYNGSDESWDGSVIEISFYIDALATRNE